MATVDNGVIVRTESNWLRVKPRCPYCGHMEQSGWNLVSIQPPSNPYDKHSNSHTCSKCRKGFRITAYYG